MRLPRGLSHPEVCLKDLGGALTRKELGETQETTGSSRRPQDEAAAFGGLGRWGEEVAARFLEERGWEVLGRNFRDGHAEVDLVVRKENVVAFVEVKCRRGLGFGHPFEAITRRKRSEVARVARGWIRKEGLPPGSVVRFDAVAVLFRPFAPPEIQHLADAWRLD